MKLSWLRLLLLEKESIALAMSALTCPEGWEDDTENQQPAHVEPLPAKTGKGKEKRLSVQKKLTKEL